MSRSLGWSTLAALAALIALLAAAPARADYVPGEVVVGYDGGSGGKARAAAREAVGGRVLERAPGFQVLRVDWGVRAAVRRLRGEPGVAWAAPNHIARIADTVPNDPHYPAQWGLARIGLPAAWDLERGSAAVTTAVIDTGVDPFHTDLDDRLAPGSAADVNGHGTHMAGIVAAETGNGAGVAGVAWDASLLALRACNDQGQCPSADVAAAILAARDAGARVANVSIEGPPNPAIASAITNSPGLLVVAAAGNGSKDVDADPVHPCTVPAPNVLCVASTSMGLPESKLGSSNFGDAGVDLGAPGSNIRSTGLGGGYEDKTGTSVAAPHVTGVAALLFSRAPGASVAAVRQTILSSVDVLPGLQGLVATNGRLSAARAVLPPQVTITAGPPAATKESTASFTWTAAKAPVSFECRLDGGGWEACTSPRQVDAPAEGAHEFEVRATDALGGQGVATRTWTVDTTAPVVTITSATTSGRTATVEFGADEAATFECRVDTGAWAACTSPAELERLANGTRVIRVRGRDAAGNHGIDVAKVTVSAPPLTEITSHPAENSASSTALFAFKAVDPATAAGFECALDGAGFSACPDRYDGLPDGPHTLRARAVDGADERGEETVFDWTIDTVAPVVTIQSAPPAETTSREAQIGFAVDGAPAAECQVDGAPFAPCTSPRALSGLADGPHVVTVRARDAAGNEGTDAATWTVDATGPSVTFTLAPESPSPDGRAQFAWTTEDGATSACSLNGAAFTACTSPATLTGLPDGTHAFAVRATDHLGNAGGPLAREFTVQRPPPTPPPAPTATPAPAPTPTPTPEPVIELEPPDEVAAAIVGALRGRTPRRVARIKRIRVPYISTMAGTLRADVVLRGKRKRRFARGVLRFAEADAGVLAVRSTKRARRVLRRRSAATLEVTVRFIPAEGDRVSARRRVRAARS